MDFKPKELKIFTKRKVLLFIGVLFLLGLLVFWLYSYTFVNNFEDLDVKAESERVGGSFYDKDGDQMYYIENQKKDPINTILFIHGFGASNFSFRNNITHFTDKSHVLAVDLLGFGMSKVNKSQDIGLDRDVDVLSSMIEDKKLNNIIIVGHSMGGIVAQKLAIKYPSKVVGLILINSMDGSKDDRNYSLLTNLAQLPLVKKPMISTVYKSIRSMVDKSYYDKTILDKMTYEGYEKGFRYKGSGDQLIKFLKSKSSSKIDLSQIKQLTLIYSSDNDEIINPSVQNDLKKEISNSTILHISKAGHLLMEEQPDLVNSGIDDWIKEIAQKINIA